MTSKVDNQHHEPTEAETGIGFSKRDLNVQKEEKTGEVYFKVVTNDGVDESLILLTCLKNIISKQLPKMPKEYIVRLVFDKKHESMVLMKGKKVIGGVCYRTNLKEMFIEIAFLAISHLEQVRGYGTRIMNKLKDHCRERGIKYFLTYADNNAIGYFKKQGFSNSIKCPTELWKDLIKDYDGGTLMETYVNPNINYSELSDNLKLQRAFIINTANRFLSVKRENKLSDLEAAIKKYKSEINHDSKNSFTTIGKKLFDAIPGMKESGWTFDEDYIPLTNNEPKLDFVSQCRNIINKVREEKISQPFLVPVNREMVQDYYEIIKDPMGKFYIK